MGSRVLLKGSTAVPNSSRLLRSLNRQPSRALSCVLASRLQAVQTHARCTVHNCIITMGVYLYGVLGVVRRTLEDSGAVLQVCIIEVAR